jgi:hypothetical protein
MKRLFFSTFLTIQIILTIDAQVSLTIKEETRTMSKGKENAFVMEVPQTKMADLKKEWGKYLKEHGKIKPEEYKGEFFVLGAIINRISAESLNHYALFNANPSGAVISCFYVIKDSFISSASNPLVAGNIKKFMFDFGKAEYIKAVEEELKIEKKILKEKEDELEDFMKAEDKEAKKIAEYKSEITQNENEITVKKQEQDLKQKEIMMQKEKMMGVNLNPEEKKLQDNIIKDMEKEKQKQIKTQSSLRKDITKKQSEIKKSERAIADYKSKQELKRNEINKHKEIVQKVEMKL